MRSVPCWMMTSPVLIVICGFQFALDDRFPNERRHDAPGEQPWFLLRRSRETLPHAGPPSGSYLVRWPPRYFDLLARINCSANSARSVRKAEQGVCEGVRVNRSEIAAKNALQRCRRNSAREIVAMALPQRRYPRTTF